MNINSFLNKDFQHGFSQSTTTSSVSGNSPFSDLLEFAELNGVYLGSFGTDTFSVNYQLMPESTEDNPILLASGTHSNGTTFQQTLYLNDIDPSCASLVEMGGLNFYLGENFDSLPKNGVNLNEPFMKQDFASLYESELSTYKKSGQMALSSKYEDIFDKIKEFTGWDGSPSDNRQVKGYAMGMATGQDSEKQAASAALAEIISGYDREMVKELEYKEEEEESWNRMITFLDHHMEMTKESMELQIEEAMDDKLILRWEAEQISRNLLLKQGDVIFSSLGFL